MGTRVLFIIAFLLPALAVAKTKERKECMNLAEVVEELSGEKNFYHQVSDIQILQENHTKDFDSFALRKFYGLRSLLKDEYGHYKKVEQSGCDKILLTSENGTQETFIIKEKSATRLLLAREGKRETWVLRQRKIMAVPLVEETMKKVISFGSGDRPESHEISVTSVTYAKKPLPYKRFVSDRFVRMLVQEVEYSLHEGGRKIASPGKPTAEPVVEPKQ